MYVFGRVLKGAKKRKCVRVSMSEGDTGQNEEENERSKTQRLIKERKRDEKKKKEESR